MPTRPDHPPSAGLRPAVFLDRDGVLIEEVGYLTRPEQLRLIPGAAEAVRELRARGFLVIVVTNQSAVARGLCSEAELARVHAELQAMLERHGTRYDDLLYCPHHPLEGVGSYRVDCSCRKPGPGMLLAAQRTHGLDLSSSFVVGDKASDIQAARNAGCRGVLVLTGYGAETAARGGAAPDLVCDTLASAAVAIVSGAASTAPPRAP